jgi:AdoMet-dependent rRNA methyltransferase SPB1
LFRNVSAEIFVVCRDFHAPKHIDPKFLDPKHVFKELTATGSISGTALDKSTSANNAHANVFMPDKKRRKRDGYDDGDYTLYKVLPAVDFIKSHDPVALLGNANKISFTSQEESHWLKMEITKDDIKANCEDLKVLGKGDFKALMKWRTLVREEVCRFHDLFSVRRIESTLIDRFGGQGKTDGGAYRDRGD